MKKRMLLTVLPALLVLSACGNAAARAENKNNIFLEDTLAHEELFDDVELKQNKLQPLRASETPVENPDIDPDPEIGIQSITENGNVSFRFVAAVKFAENQVEPTKAVWTRTISRPDGNAYKAYGTYESEKAYTKLSAGGSAYTIDQYNDSRNLTGENRFTHFVVYCVRNIPLNDANNYEKYYLSAYLTLSDKDSEDGQEGLGKTTKAIAINVEQTQKFTYVSNQGEYFITGSFVDGILRPTGIRVNGNNAEFESGLNLNANDSFVINEFYDTRLIVHGGDQLYGNESNYYFSNDNGNIKANFKGDYKLYFKFEDDTNKIFSVGDNVVRPIYVSLKDVNTWWGTSGDWTAICAFNNTTNVTPKWFKTSVDGAYLVSSGVIDPTVYDQIAVVRMSPASKDKAENELGWSDKYYNQTADLTIPDNELKDCVYINDNNLGDNKKGSTWGTRD